MNELARVRVCMLVFVFVCVCACVCVCVRGVRALTCDNACVLYLQEGDADVRAELEPALRLLVLLRQGGQAPGGFVFLQNVQSGGSRR